MKTRKEPRGRPPGRRFTKQVSIALTPQQEDALEAMAEERALGVSAIVREAIQFFLGGQLHACKRQGGE